MKTQNTENTNLQNVLIEYIKGLILIAGTLLGIIAAIMH
jgi:hypothetical protein